MKKICGLYNETLFSEDTSQNETFHACTGLILKLSEFKILNHSPYGISLNYSFVETAMYHQLLYVTSP